MDDYKNGEKKCESSIQKGNKSSVMNLVNKSFFNTIEYQMHS